MSLSNRRLTIWTLLLLAVAVLAAFWSVLDNDFVSNNIDNRIAGGSARYDILQTKSG